MTCPICKAPSVGTKPCPGYCEGVEDGREEVWRALLERDVAEVARAALDFRTREAVWLSYVALLVDSPCQARAYQREADGNAAMALDCEAWLVRARAALGGGK